MISIINSLLIPAIISLIVIIAIIKAKASDRPVGLETIIYDKVDKRKYPKIHKAQKSNNNKGSDKLNSQSGQVDSLFKAGVGDKMEKFITIKNANAVVWITLKPTNEISIQEAINLRDKLVQKTYRLAASGFYKNDDGNWIIGLRLTPISMGISKLKKLGIHVDANKIEPKRLFNEINQYNKGKIDSVLNEIEHKFFNLELKTHVGDIEYCFEKEVDFKKVIEKQQAVQIGLPDCERVSEDEYKKRNDDFFGNLSFLKALVDKAQYQGHSGHVDFNCKMYPISNLYRDIAKRALLLADEADWFNRYYESKNK